MINRLKNLLFPTNKDRVGDLSGRDSSGTHKPLFSGDYIAFSPYDRYALRALLRRINKPFIRMAAIGSWTGNGSTRTIIEELHNGRGILYCIDHWLGNANVERHRNMVSNYDMFATFRRNISLYGGNIVVKSLVMSSNDAADLIKDHTFDIVFIDGNHSYDDTILDIDLWMPKIAVGGILCGHDCEARPQFFDMACLRENKNRDTIEGNKTIPQIHPGVILAVHERFGESAHLWMEEVITLEDGSRGLSTIWDITAR